MLIDCHSLNRSTFSWKQEKVGFFVFLKHAIKEYEFDCKARKLGVNTIQGYMRMLRYLMDYLDKEYDITQIEDVKPFHIKHFLLLKQEEGKKPQYIPPYGGGGHQPTLPSIRLTAFSALPEALTMNRLSSLRTLSQFWIWIETHQVSRLETLKCQPPACKPCAAQADSGVAGAQRFQHDGEHLRASGCAKQKQHGGRHAARSGLRLPGGFEPIKEKAKQHMSLGRMLAEWVGFEPTDPEGPTDFECFIESGTCRKNGTAPGSCRKRKMPENQAFSDMRRPSCAAGAGARKKSRFSPILERILHFREKIGEKNERTLRRKAPQPLANTR